MFSSEIRRMLAEVITSWQVLAVTVVLVIYIFLVNSVARIYKRRRAPFMPKIKKNAASQEASDSEDLELEEKVEK